MNIQFKIEDRVRLASAAAEREMSVEQFVFDALEMALRPIEIRRVVYAREVAELEALWLLAGRGQSEAGDQALPGYRV